MLWIVLSRPWRVRGSLGCASEGSLGFSYDYVALDFRVHCLKHMMPKSLRHFWMLVVEPALAHMLAVRRVIVR